MDDTTKYKVGDRVYLIQEISALGKFKDQWEERIRVWIVLNPYKPTDMKRFNGEPVNFYVVLEEEKESRKGNKVMGLYHQQNLVPVNEFNVNTRYVGV